MQLTRHQTAQGARWALDARYLPLGTSGLDLLAMQRRQLHDWLDAHAGGAEAHDPLLPPLEAQHEVWASGVTYQRSREARRAESHAGALYDLVYEAERPELFLKSLGWRVAGDGAPIRVRRDSSWNVPEPELVLVINCHREIIGYSAGNDVSSRDIEGENPLYLPQAKIYDGACALGPGIQLCSDELPEDVPIELHIARDGQVIFSESISTARMKRSWQDLVTCLFQELSFPAGVYLMTGTGIVPPDGFNLLPGDVVRIAVGQLVIENAVAVEPRTPP
jgi:2-dehydro-3-deoxy-D-arabinonate dehydratase